MARWPTYTRATPDKVAHQVAHAVSHPIHPIPARDRIAALARIRIRIHTHARRHKQASSKAQRIHDSYHVWLHKMKRRGTREQARRGTRARSIKDEQHQRDMSPV